MRHILAPDNVMDCNNARTYTLTLFCQGAKVEWLLGCTVEQMSYKKALEVLGISEAVMEEERAKILGGLGVRAWANPANSTGTADRNQNGGSCGGLFGKRSHGHTLHPGSVRVFDMAPTEVRGIVFLFYFLRVYIYQT